MIENSFVVSVVQHYNHKKYWRMRDYVASHKNLLALYYLFRIKKMDAFNNASLGTHLGECAYFKSHPNLPHGINGIVVSHRAVIGENVTIFHQVTIGEGRGGAPAIGNNVYIGAGAKIIGGIKIGDNVNIGAGCIISIDVPSNCTVVMDKPRIIVRSETTTND